MQLTLHPATVILLSHKNDYFTCDIRVVSAFCGDSFVSCDVVCLGAANPDAGALFPAVGGEMPGARSPDVTPGGFMPVTAVAGDGCFKLLAAAVGAFKAVGGVCDVPPAAAASGDD